MTGQTRVGFALTGSFCTFDKALRAMEETARVLPVQGAMTSTSSNPLGPMGSAARTESMTPWPQISAAA